MTEQGLLEHGVDVLDGFEDALARVALLVPVTQLDSFAGSRGGARWHGRPPIHPGIQDDVGLNGGIAAGIDDLAAADGGNSAHGR